MRIRSTDRRVVESEPYVMRGAQARFGRAQAAEKLSAFAKPMLDEERIERVLTCADELAGGSVRSLIDAVMEAV